MFGESPCKLHYYTFGRLENRNLTDPIGRFKRYYREQISVEDFIS